MHGVGFPLDYAGGYPFRKLSLSGPPLLPPFLVTKHLRNNWFRQAERAAAEAAAEDAFRAATLARMAEDDRLEQMNAQRRRMRMAEHRREVEGLIAGKRAAFEKAQVHHHPGFARLSLLLLTLQLPHMIWGRKAARVMDIQQSRLATVKRWDGDKSLQFIGRGDGAAEEAAGSRGAGSGHCG